MRKMLFAAAAVLALVAAIDVGSAQQLATRSIAATTIDDLRTWDSFVTRALRSGDLQRRRIDRDPSLPARSVERLQQYHRGVPVWGAEMVLDSDRGLTMSIFGEIAASLPADVDAAITAAAAADRIRSGAGPDAVFLRQPALTILPMGGSRLVYTAVVSGEGDVFRVFVDADSGEEVLRYSEIQTQAAVGTGLGVIGDTKKLSVLQRGGAFVTDDQHRPPLLTTFDMRADFLRTLNVLNGFVPLLPSDVASDADNTWTDVSAVDAHAHIGWTYDYYFKRHGRHGLDDRDRPIVTLINAATQQQFNTAPPIFVANAFWCDPCGPGGVGVMFFGNGVPPGVFSAFSGQNVAQLAGAIDIAGHELTHAVISSSSNLIYLNESGALNEAFADMMGTSVEFFHQTPGPNRGQADYLGGEDVFRAFRPGSVNGVRSMENPGMFGDPDHYSRRFIGELDNGGVHTNSAIANHAFYLAIEGGTNRTSGLPVQGVGAANREQIEKVFYRAFVFLLPPSATFATARAATIQAARDLYGANSAAERAVTQAWTAVGVS